MATRQFVSFPFTDLSKIKQQVLNWSTRFDTCCFLDNQSYASPENSFECLAAVGEITRLKANAGTAFDALKKFSIENPDWIFGHFSYDLKSETENIPSGLPDAVRFPDLFFFVPETVLLVDAGGLHIGSFGNHRELMKEIEREPEFAGRQKNEISKTPAIRPRISKSEYLETLGKLHQHILRGDCYEINYCQEFFAENIRVDPLLLYRSLNKVSPSPFSAYYSVDKNYLLCASPERFLKRAGQKIISQPIKGTSARDLNDIAHDKALKMELADSEKDRAENVMVVDLVRNDLSKICVPDSVRVSELFGIYSFAQVHQMISTIVGRPIPGLHWTDMIAGTFPMGSMTGAPKRRVLELIEKYEKSKRGIFSGALGYVKPNQDFDFNVVIRSLLYNGPDQYLAWFAGSGITVNSIPEKEYEECLLKVAAFEMIIKNPSL